MHNMAFIPQLHIYHLGPIENCDITMNRMIVLDGPQAAGKSTIAKAIFFFRTVKEEIYKSFIEGLADPVPWLNARWYLLKKLNRILGNYMSVKRGTYLSYEYAPNVKIEIRLAEGVHSLITFSPLIIEALEKYRDIDYKTENMSIVRRELQELFADKSEIVYLPAGRSFTSLLNHQLNYILMIMKDKQKDTLDYCMQDYIEQVMKIRPQFVEQQLSDEVAKIDSAHFEFMRFVREYIGRILKGRYVNINGEEGIKLFDSDSDKPIPLDFASSGQQEVLWILNLIYYYLREKHPTMFIIEEPEAHLYPDSQKEIAEYIALALHGKNECVVTTHSPYILGAMNNLLDIKRIADKGVDVAHLLEENGLIGSQLLNHKDFAAYFVDNGTITDAMDEETGLIRNEMIDGASDTINRLADEIFAMECGADE
ncbi:MAG: AAA family ATPase [Selenomonadaceae bacterium]|nr:AAA family ATPase [Selenomonadaceae bacterium]